MDRARILTAFAAALVLNCAARAVPPIPPCPVGGAEAREQWVTLRTFADDVGLERAAFSAYLKRLQRYCDEIKAIR